MEKKNRNGDYYMDTAVLFLSVGLRELTWSASRRQKHSALLHEYQDSQIIFEGQNW